MSEPRFFRLVHDTARQLAASYCLAAPEGTRVLFEDGDRRTGAQNDYMWALLDDIAEQVVWYGKKLTADDWKDVLTASLRKARVVPTIDGDGFVPLGMRTSRMSKKEMQALIDLGEAFAAQQGVVRSERRVDAEAVR